jgi:hypothetical protein
MKSYVLAITILLMTYNLAAQNENNDTLSSRLEENKSLAKGLDSEGFTKLNLLESIEIDEHVLKFKKVQNDGRCPMEVTCVWPGEATIILEIDDGEYEVIHPIILSALGGHQKILQTTNHKVYVKNLKPYPTRVGEELEAYHLVLQVEPLLAD